MPIKTKKKSRAIPRCPSVLASRCDNPRCPGWDWFNDCEIERCDECHRFRDDMAAALHVQTCAACRKYLKTHGNDLVVRGTGYQWDELRLCKTGDPGCWHGFCLTCTDSECFPPGIEIRGHKCTHAEHAT